MLIRGKLSTLAINYLCLHLFILFRFKKKKYQVFSHDSDLNSGFFQFNYMSDRQRSNKRLLKRTSARQYFVKAQNIRGF